VKKWLFVECEVKVGEIMGFVIIEGEKMLINWKIIKYYLIGMMVGFQVNGSTPQRFM
jgi:hypothetical protein